MKEQQAYLRQIQYPQRIHERKLKRIGRGRPGVSFHTKLPFRGPIDFPRNQNEQVIKQTEIYVPENFSLIENTENTLLFFKDFQKLTKSVKRIYVRWDQVKNTTPDSLLYILSILHACKEQRRKIYIHANRPTDEACRTLIEQSGFYNYTDMKKKPKCESEDIYDIQKGRQTERLVVRNIKTFCTTKLSLDRFSQKGKAIQAMLLECTTNTNDHAYKQKNLKTNYWWVFAIYKDSKIQITFLDNGLGIPNTVKKRLFSLQHIASDETLILKALEGGQIVSGTGKNYRNKGLPKIYSYVQKEKWVDKMFILSDKGYLEASDQECKTESLTSEFTGTLFQFIISNGN